MKEGKLLLWDASNKDSDLHEFKLDQRDWTVTVFPDSVPENNY